MVTLFEEITETLTEKEMLLLPYVERVFKKFDKKSLQVKTNVICEVINNLYVHECGLDKFYIPMNGVRLRKFVNYFRVNGILAIIGTSEGYFVTNDKIEIEKQIKSLTERANGILAAAEGLKNLLAS